MLVAHVLIELSQQETHAHLVVALEALDGLCKVWNGLFGFLRLDVIICKRCIGKRAYTFVGNLVQMDV